MQIDVDIEQLTAEQATQLGFYLEKGLNGYVQDYEKAAELYTHAANLNDGTGWNNLGWLYANGFGVPQNLDTAIACYINAANQLNTVAMINLGNIYEGNQYLNKQDYDEALFWYHEAALMGSSKGLFNYANMYFHGWGVEQNYKIAYRYFKKLAEDGYPGAYFYLGVYEEYGFLGEVDYEQALCYYLMDVEEYPYAACNVGRMYSLGLGVEKNEAIGFEYYLQAATSGDALGWANVGYCFETGQGVEQSILNALDAYQKGASMGEEHCREALERLKSMN